MSDAEGTIWLIAIGFVIFLVMLWILLPFLVKGVSKRVEWLYEEQQKANQLQAKTNEELAKLRKAVNRLPRARHHQPEENGDDDGFVSGRGEQHVAK